jgi:hypothetical protein
MIRSEILESIANIVPRTSDKYNTKEPQTAYKAGQCIVDKIQILLGKLKYVKL